MNDFIIESIDLEISRLQQARELLSGLSDFGPLPIKRGPGRPRGTAITAPTKKPRVMSPEARARIAAAQKEEMGRCQKVKSVSGLFLYGTAYDNIGHSLRFAATLPTLKDA